MNKKTLKQVVAEKPYPDYGDWWDMGNEFLKFMSGAIYAQWADLHYNDGDLETVRRYVADYLSIVYGRTAGNFLVAEFVAQEKSSNIRSGEFDALSYAFYRSAFELIEHHLEAYERPLAEERRLFTKRVGKEFFGSLKGHLWLRLPNGLHNQADFTRLASCVRQVGAFLKDQGYLRDHFAFHFDLDLVHNNRRITQKAATFIAALNDDGIAYALYEMGYPVILPSAVYLYHTLGEAQHHSSRTIEDLFELAGYQASETDDFDPTGYPPDRVVELWEIRKLP